MRWMVSTAYYDTQPGNFRLIKQKIEDTYQMFNQKLGQEWYVWENMTEYYYLAAIYFE